MQRTFSQNLVIASICRNNAASYVIRSCVIRSYMVPSRCDCVCVSIMPLFGKSHKGPADIVKTLKENLAILVKQDKKTEKASEEVSKCLVSMKEILYGSNDKEPHTETVAQLAQELYNSGLLISLVENLQVIDFEGKKDVCQIFNNILRRQIGTRSPTVEYFCSHQDVLFILLKGYETSQVALNCGIMLRECIRHEPLAKIVLHSENFNNFFNYVEMSTFDIASDAFATFKDLLTRHKVLVAEYLEQNYDAVFADYEKLLHSENYVTKRQSLKLLGELLLDRHNFTVMTRYISKPENLKLMMNLLRDKSPNIQFEAFHVFKVFVANPNKTQPIIDILLKNQTKLIEFLSNFQKERTDDEQFNDEKTYLIKQIRDLKKPAS
uniref:Calcium binding protein 39-like protein n=2 Tax=Gouania willdenowi TaxID=441366 RepID=A0A8C5HUZ3_GOUWI